jgi:uncharacterized lipoprotein NlpE involved in copper resistance
MSKNTKTNYLLWPFLIALSLSLVTADGNSLKAGAGQPNRGQKKGPKAVYEGVLPCADCEGIKTELTLYRKAESSDPATYRLSETYLGRRGKGFVSTGKWAITHGAGAQAEATVYQLDPDKPDRMRSFLVINDTQIRQLDKQQQEFDSKLNYTLTKRGGSRAGAYRAIPGGDSGAVAAADFAVGEEQRRSSQAVSLVSIAQAQSQVVAGMNYKLCLKVKTDGQLKEASAVVYRNLQQQYSLTSWSWEACKK